MTSNPLRPLTISGRDPRRAVTFPVPLLLAPMDGVTDRCYRDLVLDLGHAGGACTEFVRISVDAIPSKVMRRELGDPHPNAPVGLQLMAAEPEHVPRSVENAVSVGAPWIDLNFGCPVKRVFNKCAGSALLQFPEQVGAIVAEAVAATAVPVSAKIRAGVEDASLLDEIVDACAGAGAAAVTLHARLRSQSYREPANWEWIARAVQRLDGRTPLIGNGSIERADDVHRMLAETGCDGVMVGRGAFADPFVFREARWGARATLAEAVDFAQRYFDALCPPGCSLGALGRFKQMLRFITSGGIFSGREDERSRLLRSRDRSEVAAWIAARAEDAARVDSGAQTVQPVPRT